MKEYSVTQLFDIKAKILAKVNKEFELATLNDEVDDLLDRYGIIFEEEPMQVNTRTMKVLVLGTLSGRLKDFQLAVKKLGIDINNVEFVDTYEDSRFDIKKLEYSMDYSDIIYGPNPHKQIGIGSNSSALAQMKKNPEKYPRVIEAIANDKLKITISGFKNALLRTRYFETLTE